MKHVTFVKAIFEGDSCEQINMLKRRRDLSPPFPLEMTYRPCGERLPTYFLYPHAYDLASFAVTEECTVSDFWQIFTLRSTGRGVKARGNA